MPRPLREHRARDEIDLEIADAQYRLLHHRGAAARQRIDPRQHLGEGERLDEIIVAAGAQAAHAVVDLAERADDERRRGDAVLAQAADDRRPSIPGSRRSTVITA